MNAPKRRPVLADFAAELRRRRVVRFALGYAAAAFVILQLGEIVLPAFGMGEWGLRILVTLVALGFLPGVALAWIFELTDHGLRRTEGGKRYGVLPRMVFLVAAVLTATGLAGWLSARGAFDPAPNTATAIALEAYDPSQPVSSIAVLPLDDFSPGGDQAYFVAGLQEELTAELSRIEWLRVASRTSAMQYQASGKSAPLIGRELGVYALLEGSVIRSQDQVRITLQLIHAASDSHIRTFRFDQEATDMLALQTEVAQEVAAEILAPQGGDEPGANRQVAIVRPPGATGHEAQEAYLRGRYHFGLGTAEGYRAAIEYFESATRSDSGFAPALAGLAGARFLADIDDGVLDRDEMARALEDATRAVAADPGSAEAGEVLRFLERNVLRRRTRRADSLPGMAPAELDTAWVMTTTGLGRRLEDAVGRRILETERDHPGRETFAGVRLAFSGSLDTAIEVLEGVVARHPDADPAWSALARTRASAEDTAGLVATVHRWSAAGAQDAPDEETSGRLEQALVATGIEAYWSWQLDRLQGLRADGRRIRSSSLAEASLGAGDRQEALAYLREALEEDDPRLQMIRSDPAWDDLRDDPEFRAIVRETRTRFTGERAPGPGPQL